MSRCELVVFDWDGTLMDSTGRIVEAVRTAIDAGGLAPRSDEQIREVIGLGMAEAVAALYPDMAEAARARLTAVYREAFVRTVAQRPAELFPGVEPVLARLEAEGYLLAIATGKSRPGLQRDLAHAGIGRRFVATRTVDECGSKPDPHMLRDLLAELDLGPHRALMVGDTLFDLEMARNAGVASVAVSWGAHAPERLRAAGPERVIDRIDELPDWLARRTGDRAGAE